MDKPKLRKRSNAADLAALASAALFQPRRDPGRFKDTRKRTRGGQPVRAKFYTNSPEEKAAREVVKAKKRLAKESKKRNRRKK